MLCTCPAASGDGPVEELLGAGQPEGASLEELLEASGLEVESLGELLDGQLGDDEDADFDGLDCGELDRDGLDFDVELDPDGLDDDAECLPAECEEVEVDEGRPRGFPGSTGGSVGAATGPEAPTPGAVGTLTPPPLAYTRSTPITVAT